MRKSLQLSVVFAALVPACGGNDQIAVEAVSDDGQEVSAQAVSLIQLRGEQLGLDRNDVVRQRSRLVMSWVMSTSASSDSIAACPSTAATSSFIPRPVTARTSRRCWPAAFPSASAPP
jgi:hypothetical protein